jgi:hypothetical protein
MYQLRWQTRCPRPGFQTQSDRRPRATARRGGARWRCGRPSTGTLPVVSRRGLPSASSNQCNRSGQSGPEWAILSSLRAAPRGLEETLGGGQALGWAGGVVGLAAAWGHRAGGTAGPPEAAAQRLASGSLRVGAPPAGSRCIGAERMLDRRRTGARARVARRESAMGQGGERLYERERRASTSWQQRVATRLFPRGMSFA